MTASRLTLITRPGCHLCQIAEETLDRVAAETGESWQRVDVTESIELERDYGDRVPVLLAPPGDASRTVACWLHQEARPVPG